MKEIRPLIYHIILVVIILVMSMIIWPNNNINIVDTKDVLVSFEGYKSISVLTDEDYLTAIPSNLYLKNTSNNKVDYKLSYKYSKTSTLDINSITISLDNKVYKLNELEYIEDEDYIYFILDNYSLNSYETELIATRIWTDKSEGSVTSTFVAL